MTARLLTISFVAAGIFAGTAFAQTQRQGDFKLKTIRQSQVDAPNFGGAASDLGGRPTTLARKWLKIEVQFESDADWADDVQLKFYVLVGKGREAKLFVGDVTHINVAKGSQHYSAMFMQPNSLKRFGAGQIEAVGVQLFYENRLIASESEPPANRRWWEDYKPISGYLLPPQETPWAPVAHERFEAVKQGR